MLRKERAVRARLGSVPAKNIYVLSTIPVNYRICSIRSYLKTRQGGGHDESMYPLDDRRCKGGRIVSTFLNISNVAEAYDQSPPIFRLT